MRGTFFLSLILNFMLAGVLLRGKVEIPWPQNRSQPSHGSKEGDGGVLLGLFFLGVGGMAAEVVWTRGLLIVLGSTTYTVSLVIGLFLAGMGLGSWVYSKGGNALSSGSIPAAVGCFIIAVGVFLSIPLLSRIPVAYSYAQILFGSHPVGRSLIRMVCAAAILLIPTIGMGAVFPWWMQRAKHCTTEQGYAVLCFGNAAGCLMAGFVLLPFLEIKNGLMVISGLYALAGGIDLYAGSRYRWIPIVFLGTGFLVVGSATPAVWDKKIFSSGAFLYAPTTDGWKGVRNFWTSVRAYQLSFAKDGPTSTVTVWKSPEGPPFLRINGKTDASIGRDMDTQILSATLPLLLNGGVEQQALVIGFGSGITSGLLAEDPRCASVTVVEIEPAVLEAGDCFSKENRHVLRNKKLKQVVMDARGWLLKDHRRYDVITAEPSNLWIGGMAHLYTREAFRLYRERLTGSGVFCQWIQGYGISEDDFRRVMATFNDVFPHVALVSARNGDFFMVGSPRPWGDPEHSFAPSRGATVNIPLGLGKKAAPVVPTALWVLDEAAFRYSSQGYGIHTDDRPFLEFSTPAQMGKDASVEIQNNLILESAGLRLQ
jgi:spermidine synthase